MTIIPGMHQRSCWPCPRGEKWPGIEYFCMRDHSQKNLGIDLLLEIVGEINT